VASNSAMKGGGADLRRRALSRLTGPGLPAPGRLDPSAAFKALYDLAQSPSTAHEALALLHELQVHQVELELQDEELRRSRTELEATLNRQVQLYDAAPAGLLTVDQRSVVSEVNTAAARLLRLERGAVLGRPLVGLLAADSARALQSMLARLADGADEEVGALQLAMPDGTHREVRAAVSRDPAGTHFLVALVKVDAGT
jgi:PAS domain S-box-containing protein